MKLKRLSIKNITSIEEAIIDFDSKPLADASIFLITGPTGAGKSTILDAICLALYGTTPRLSMSKNSGVYEANEKAQGANKINSPFHLLRRSTGRGSIELDFLGRDGCEYKATWLVRKTNDEPDEKHQKITSILHDVTQDKTYTKKQDIESKIEEVTGLTLEQFCRTTMLAQGEFNKFLTAEPKDRSDILEKLTGTGLFSDIGVEIYKRYLQAKREYEELNKLIAVQSQQLLSEEDKVALLLELEQLGQEIVTLSLDLKQKREVLSWLNREEQLRQKLFEAQVQEEEYHAEAQSTEIRERISLINRWESSLETRLKIDKYDILEQKQLRLEHEQEDWYHCYQQLCGQIQTLQIEIDQTETDLRRLRQKQEKLLPQCTMYDNFANIQGALLTYLQEGERAEKSASELQSLLQAIEAMSPKIEQAQKKVNDAKQVLIEVEQEVELQRMAYNEEQHNQVLRLIKHRQELSVAEEQYKLSQEQQEKAENKRQVTLQKIESLQQGLHTGQQKLKQAELAYQQASQSLNDSAWSLEQMCKSIRSKLQEGEPCPVCLNRVEHLVSDAEVEKLLKPYEERIEIAKKQVARYQEEVLGVEAELRVMQNTINTQNYEIQELNDKLQEQLRGIELIHQDRIEFLPELQSLSLKELQEEGAKADRLKVQLHQTNQRLCAYSQTYTLAEQKYREQRNNLLQLEQEQQRLQNELNTKYQNQERQLEIARQYITIEESEWQPAWQTQPKAWLTQLEIDKNIYTQLTKNLSESQTRHSRLQEELSRLQEIAGRVKEVEPEWSEGFLDNLELKPLDKNEVAQIAGLVSSLKKQHHECTRELHTLQEDILSYCRVQNLSVEDLQILKGRQEEIVQLQRKEQERQARMQEAGHTLRTYKQEYEAHCAIANEKWNKETPQRLKEQIADAEFRLNEKNQIIGQGQHKLQEQERQIRLIANKLEEIQKLQQDYEEWKFLNDLYGGQDGERFRRIAQSFVLEQLLRSANIHLACFIPHYELQCSQPGELTILIRNKINNSLIGVPNLSGGESFIVSLALALGLSQIGNKRLSIDILFIDEGFGTLSSEALEMVMTTLEALRRKSGCRVGVISHVDSLKDRIPTQIQLSRIDATKSQVVIKSL